MTTAVDTNALLGILYEGDYSDDAESALRNAYRKGRIVTTPIVYAELAADGHFGTMAELDEFFSDLSIQIVEPTRKARYRAGEKFQIYTQRRPDGLQCPTCGNIRSIQCQDCGGSLAPRQHIAADFLIGGHAEIDADALITFDQAFYDSYFPSLTLNP